MTYQVMAEIDQERKFTVFAAGQTDLYPTGISIDVEPSGKATCMAFFERNLSETDKAFEIRVKREILKKYDQEYEVVRITRGLRL